MNTSNPAREHAEQVIAHCWERAQSVGEAIERLERWATVRNSDRACPVGFTGSQRAAVQRRVLREMLRAIGRA